MVTMYSSDVGPVRVQRSTRCKFSTVHQEFAKQSDEENRIYYEPRCIAGNYGLPGLLHGRPTEEHAFAEGRGPDPAISDNMTAGSALDGDPLR